jgi:hypothetical protein
MEQELQREPENKVAEFAEKYNALCKEYGLGITASPTFKLRDDGTFSVVVEWSIKPLDVK